MSGPSLAREFFEDLYAAHADPWDFETSAYEREKYDRSLAVLRPHYRAALEIGCSIGVFTQRLADRCDALTALDISDRALATARERCAAQPQVGFARADVTRAFPPQQYDLIVLSEVGYYWSDADLVLARELIVGHLRSGGELLLVHFLPAVAEYPRDGDAVHAAFLADERLERVHAHRAERYRLDLLVRR